ncbi:MAG: glycosyltransferase [Candidatus Marinimicrobia bacterium]|nr:glycosyltransferase [Candidatus Neomarinimicrobiota bacterium]
MNLSDKTLAVYYHMPFVIKEDCILSNPVIGTFIESLVPYFEKVLVFGFECASNHDPITYLLSNKKIEFVSLGPEGRGWDHLQKMHRMRSAIKHNKKPIDILLLRVPSHKAYAVWKYAGKPDNTALLFIGNPFFTPAYSNIHGYMYLFRKFRSELHDRRMGVICRQSSAIVIANSQMLVDLWSRKLKTSLSLIHTSSISENDILVDHIRERFNQAPYVLLFVGRVCYDKGIRELFGALKELNRKNTRKFNLDIVGPLGDLGGNEINELVQQYGISEYVNYHGAVPFGETLFKFYRNSDAYILPSYHEGMPKTIWEAMSQGTPVIASEIDGMKDNFFHEMDILFIQPRSSESISAAVLKLCSSQELVKKLQKNGIEKAYNFTRELQAEKIIAHMHQQWENN